MCMSCGCGEPDNDHGNPDHITRERMERAAHAAGTDIEQAADNIHASARALTGKAGAAASAPLPDAEGAQESRSMSSHGGMMGSGSSTGSGEGTAQDHGVRS